MFLVVLRKTERGQIPHATLSERGDLRFRVSHETLEYLVHREVWETATVRELAAFLVFAGRQVAVERDDLSVPPLTKVTQRR